jgi:hypothetical protein
VGASGEGNSVEAALMAPRRNSRGGAAALATRARSTTCSFIARAASYLRREGVQREGGWRARR